MSEELPARPQEVIFALDRNQCPFRLTRQSLQRKPPRRPGHRTRRTMSLPPGVRERTLLDWGIEPAVGELLFRVCKSFRWMMRAVVPTVALLELHAQGLPREEPVLTLASLHDHHYLGVVCGGRLLCWRTSSEEAEPTELVAEIHRVVLYVRQVYHRTVDALQLDPACAHLTRENIPFRDTRIAGLAAAEDRHLVGWIRRWDIVRWAQRARRAKKLLHGVLTAAAMAAAAATLSAAYAAEQERRDLESLVEQMRATPMLETPVDVMQQRHQAFLDAQLLRTYGQVASDQGVIEMLSLIASTMPEGSRLIRLRLSRSENTTWEVSGEGIAPAGVGAAREITTWIQALSESSPLSLTSAPLTSPASGRAYRFTLSGTCTMEAPQ